MSLAHFCWNQFGVRAISCPAAQVALQVRPLDRLQWLGLGISLDQEGQRQQAGGQDGGKETTIFHADMVAAGEKQTKSPDLATGA